MDYVRLFLVTMVLLLSIIPASAQSTEFTYQGRLLSGEVPANGAHDFEFLLWDEITAGNQIGSTVTLTSVNVNNGVFSVRIDFGNQFPGANRFLEIKVRQSGTGSPFSSLNPRQAISSSPYAIKSINAENAASAEHATNANQLGGVAAGQFVVTNDPRMTDARQPLPSSGNYIQNSSSPQVSSNFYISGRGRADVLDAATQFDLSGTRILSAPGVGNLFVGTNTGTSATGSQNAIFGRSAGRNLTSGASNSFFGFSAGNNTTSGLHNSFFGANTGFSNTGAANSFFGYHAGVNHGPGNNNTAIGYFADFGPNAIFNSTAIGSNSLVTQNSSIVLGSINGINGATADARVGIGTTSPVAKLTVVGSGAFNATGAARFDLFNSAANAGFLQHVTDAGLWQLATTAGVTRLVLDPSGNIGIGTTTPGARLHVVGSSGTVTAPVAVLHSSGSQVPLAFSTSGTEVARVRADSSGNLVLATVGGASKDIYFRAGDDSSTPRLFIDGATGNVGIGTTNPLSNLSVTGSVSISNLLTIGNLDGSSSVHLCRSSVDAVAACTSSIRYKKNVVTLASGLDLIRKLRPVTFNWKTNNGAEIGLIAEEVAKIEPRLTFNNSKGEVEGVNYDSVGVVVVNAVNEQQTEIEAQRDRIRRLEAQVELLTRLLCAQNPSAEFCGPKK